MGSRVKKERRKSGVKFTKAPKVPTPLEDRHEFREEVRGALGTRKWNQTVPRSKKKLAKVRQAWGLS